MKWLGRRVRSHWPRESLGFEGSESGWDAIGRRIERRQGTRPPDPDWLRGQAEENIRCGAPATLREKVAKVADGRGMAVITGQQVALLGGPLYSVYKLMTAIVLARSLEERFGRPVLPVFWSVSDDADFGEVSSHWIARPEGRLVKLRVETIPPGGTRIGTLPVETQRLAVEEQADVLAGFPCGSETLARLAGLWSHATNWQQLQTSLFHELISEDFLVVDGGDPEMLSRVTPWLREMGDTGALRRDLEEGAERSRALGFEPSFEADLAERALFRLEGDLRLPREVGEQDTPGPLAPNVVLRPLLQDYLFPNLATVCGPSEIRYRAQLGPVYGNRTIPEPLRVPRLSAVLAPPLGRRMAHDLTGYERVLEDPKQFVQEQIESEPTPTVESELSRIRHDLRAQIDRLRPELEGIDKSLPQLIDSAAGKADYQFERMLEGIRGKTRQQLLRREPILSALPDWIRPRDREQERVLGVILPVLLEGWKAFDPIRAIINESIAPILEGVPEEIQEVFLLDPFGPEDS